MARPRVSALTCVKPRTTMPRTRAP
jgi:hypothetical protein